MKTRALTAMVLSVGILAACAGRTANPVATLQPHDDALSCPQIAAEIEGITQKIAQLQEEKDSSRNQNIAIGTVGAILFWPALFALDLSDAEEEEIDALRLRMNHLTALNASRDCAAITVETANPA